MKLIIGVTGATGAPIAIKLLKTLKELKIETHLILSKWAAVTIAQETSYSVKDVKVLADYTYGSEDQAASISSGSKRVDGMIIVPCSMKTLAAIRIGLADNLIARAADVMLKERKQLLLMTRETPLNTIHLENMTELSRMGVTIFPPMPAFYNQPQTIDDLIEHIVYRALDQFGIEHQSAKRWEGLKDES
ncbi:non-oxidative hydroxyarylic acid decarboxylases subunit B [Bacillus sp. Marseille-P3800]|uniref:non-oxidative hydroxyarylic acid decarboxylases subunit B n=1 Tax=Bacillus sp. Marseille-P3800 TaxID=2014782 RepID=UPI000C07024C|nr:non-oxidative hydroxyarylic acid decarboxylases subunit B [Bacillus sp. Marseille-P3800]